MKLRLVAVVVGLVVMATGQESWAEGVQPSAEPRFGVEGERHRMVLPLSAASQSKPVLERTGRTITVKLGDLRIPARKTYRPKLLAASARGIDRGSVGPDGVSLHVTRDVVSEHSFLLGSPPRLVIDAYLEPASAKQAGAKIRQQSSFKPATSPPAKSATASAARSPGRRKGQTKTRTEPPKKKRHSAAAATAKAPPEGEGPLASAVAKSRKSDGAVDTASPTQESGAAALPAYRIEYVNESPIIWPDLDAPMYSRADTAPATAKFVTPRRHAVAALRRTGSAPRIEEPELPDEPGPPSERPLPVLPAEAPAAAHYLEADLAYLRATAGEGSYFTAIALYRRAQRVAPGFADRYRAWMMVGFGQLGMQFAADAAGEFIRLADATGTPSVTSLALLSAGRAMRAARQRKRAVALLRRAILTAPGSDGGCLARAELGAILAEHRHGKEALALYEEMRAGCPGRIVRAPRTLLKHAGVLAAAGHMKRADELLLALPEFEGELFVRRKFLEADLARAMKVPQVARRAYDTVRMLGDASPVVRAEATLRLARLEGGEGNLERAGALVSEVAVGTRSPAIRAKALTTAADLLITREQFPEALQLLEETDRLSPIGFTLAEPIRARAFRLWLGQLAERGDDAGILAVFYRYRGDGVGTHLAPDDIVRVADAAGRSGLHDLAGRILAPVHERIRGTARVEAQRILAEAALAKGESAEALRVSGDVGRAPGSLGSQAAFDRIRGRALLGLGRIDEAAQFVEAEGASEELLALSAAYLRDGQDPQKAYAIMQSAVTDPTGNARGTFQDWVAMADAAHAAGDHTLAATALRTAIGLFPEENGPGVHYRLAQFESAGQRPSRAADSYAAAAANEHDPLLARAAAADAAYYRAVERRGLGQ